MKIFIILIIIVSILYNVIKLIIMSKEDIKYLFEMIKLKFTQPKKDDGYLEWKELCRQKREIDLVEAAKMHKASFNDVTKHVHTELRKKGK
jgi:hypothetical protein